MSTQIFHKPKCCTIRFLYNHVAMLAHTINHMTLLANANYSMISKLILFEPLIDFLDRINCLLVTDNNVSSRMCVCTLGAGFSPFQHPGVAVTIPAITHMLAGSRVMAQPC